MRRGETGAYETTTFGGEAVRAFVPARLPPRPPLDLGALHVALERASLSLGRLDSLAALLPDPHIFLYTYVRKEAVLSSQIEGTQSSLSDLLLFEVEGAPGAPIDDVVEVSNYVAALEHGLARMRGDDFPLSNRLICEMHGRLLARGRGAGKSPGEFRRSQNWIGGSRPGAARFVPPPPHRVGECMSDLERFWHRADLGLAALLKAGLAHAQFETVHPVPGRERARRAAAHHAPALARGRAARADVVLKPLLQAAARGVLRALERGARDAVTGRRGSSSSWRAWPGRRKKPSPPPTGCWPCSARISSEPRRRAAWRAPRSASTARFRSGPSPRSRTLPGSRASRSRRRRAGCCALERLGIVRELTGKKRNRLFGYEAYLSILNEGTEV